MSIAGRRIGIAEMASGDEKDTFRVTLGSCVGICIFHCPSARFAVAHVLLPRFEGKGVPRKPARFASTAVAALLEEFGEIERRRDVIAFVAGGGSMYSEGSTDSGVGSNNSREALAALAAAGVRVAKSDFGGTLPRQMIIDGPAREVRSLVMSPDPHVTVWEFPARFGLDAAA